MNLQFLFLSISFYFFPTRDRKTINLQPLFIRNTFASRNLKGRKNVPPCEVRTSIFFTMTKIKIFNYDLSGSVRTMTNERGEMTNERGESSFAGKDVAKALGFSKTTPTKNLKTPENSHQNLKNSHQGAEKRENSHQNSHQLPLEKDLLHQAFLCQYLCLQKLQGEKGRPSL